MKREARLPDFFLRTAEGIPVRTSGATQVFDIQGTVLVEYFAVAQTHRGTGTAGQANADKPGKVLPQVKNPGTGACR